MRSEANSEFLDRDARDKCRRTTHALASLAERLDGRMPAHPHSSSTALTSVGVCRRPPPPPIALTFALSGVEQMASKMRARDTELVQWCHGAPGCVGVFTRMQCTAAADVSDCVFD
jgi:hypothetical protein